MRIALLTFTVALHVVCMPITWCQQGPGYMRVMGGAGFEQARDIATDREGNIFVTGGAASADFPATKGVFQRQVKTGGTKTMDAFVAKYTSQGELVWATLLGGPEYDRAYAVEVDSSGSVYIAGRAGKGLPVTRGAFQQKFGGDADVNRLYGEQDGFVAKISRDGATLLWCSYFGGADRGFIRDIALDAAGDVYVVETETRAQNPHVSTGALQPVNKGGYDAVVARISASGTAVTWATFLGGTGDDFIGPAIRLRNDGSIVVAGTTTSGDLPARPTSFDTSFNGVSDIYVAVLDAEGHSLLAATYVGGAGEDGTETHNLAVDEWGNVIVAATTSSEDLPVSMAAFQRHYGGSGGAGRGQHTNYPFDGFVAKLNPDLSQMIALTYFGGSAGEGIEGAATDADGNIFFSGASFSGLQNQANAGGADAFICVMSPDLSAVRYFSFAGGTGFDYGRAICVDRGGAAFICGETGSREITNGDGRKLAVPNGFFAAFPTSGR